MTLIDLSHPLGPAMPSYPGVPEPRFHILFTHEQSVARGNYAPGTTFQIATYEIAGNTGTYVDAPFHRHASLADLAKLPLDRLANLPAIVVAVALEGAVGPEAFVGLAVRGKAVLVHSGWAQRWGGDYFRSGPYLTAAACEALVAAGAALVGIDCANLDAMTDKSRPAHTILLGASIPIIEHLCSLEQLPAEGSRFFAVPPAIEGGTSFPVRAFAILE